MDIWSTLYQTLKQVELEESEIIVRLVWTRRNEVTHGKGFSHPNFIVNKAIEELQAFKNIPKNYKDQYGTSR